MAPPTETMDSYKSLALHFERVCDLQIKSESSYKGMSEGWERLTRITAVLHLPHHVVNSPRGTIICGLQLGVSIRAALAAPRRNL